MAVTRVQGQLTDLASAPAVRSRGELRMVMRELAKDKAAVLGGAILVLIGLSVVFAQFLAPYDPLLARSELRLRPVGTPGYLLGTDELGRDMLSRLLFGGQISLRVAVMPVVLAVIFGTAIGLVSAFYGGWLDAALMRSLDVLLAIPSVLMAVAIGVALGPGIENVVIAITVVALPVLARIVRANAQVVRSQPYVEAARACGAGDLRILVRHLLPNCLSPIVVYATLETGRVVVLSATLSFLGLGAQPPTPDWGAMLSTGRQVMTVAPHVATLPGLAILVVALCFNLLGDGLRDALDPRLRGR